jgi:drug/metabolite transporter (DMT)-like permease
MLSALTYACMLVGVNQEPVSEVSSETLVFYMMLVGAGMFGLMLAPSGRIPLPRNALGWGSVAGIVLLPSILSFFGTAWAIRLVGSTPVAIIGALEPVTAVALGMLFLRERPTPLNFAGIALILAAVVLVVLRGTPRGAK